MENNIGKWFDPSFIRIEEEKSHRGGGSKTTIKNKEFI